jgi:hypothetical protein
MLDFRSEARKALKRARSELGGGDDGRLKYAALELRLAMEAITYDRAHAYCYEMPPREYETWQPKKVMQLLVNIDPNADGNSSLAFGIEGQHGKPAKDMQMPGSEEVLKLKTLKDHYDALGSYLHMPTLKQLNERGEPDLGKLRIRCNELADAIDKVLALTIFDITTGSFATIDCSQCGEVIRRRHPLGEEEVEAKCFECGAGYVVRNAGEGKSLWEPIGQQILSITHIFVTVDCRGRGPGGYMDPMGCRAVGGSCC